MAVSVASFTMCFCTGGQLGDRADEILAPASAYYNGGKIQGWIQANDFQAFSGGTLVFSSTTTRTVSTTAYNYDFQIS